ncbi:unnamed protein product, partial [Anisakis simplex]|uniref:Peptidase A1 domain-containing protein n=1 Tax=Anisakis simplex TaxID=6269 RepID=A0A0M3K9P6_ANISI
MFSAIQFFIVLLALSCATDALYRVQLTRRKRILNTEAKRKPSPSRSFRYFANKFTYPPMLAEEPYDLPLNNYKNTIYTGTITIGVPPQEFEASFYHFENKVNFDTGSDLLWVNCAGCSAGDCQKRAAFNCSQSRYCSPVDAKPDPIKYAKGHAWGPIDKDYVCVCLKIVVIIEQIFDSANSFLEFLSRSELAELSIGDASSGFCGRKRQNLTCAMQRGELAILEDGIFGLSAEGLQPGTESAMGQLLRYSGCEEKKVAFWLNRDSEAKNGGEVTICGVDKNHYQGDLVWIPLEHGPHWYVRMDDVLIGSHRMSLGQTEAVIDSGWSYMAVPSEEYFKVTFNARNSLLCRCSSVDELPTLTFVLNGNPFSIPPEAYAVKVLFDTGSWPLWVDCVGCSDEECQKRAKFSCSQSTTCSLVNVKPTFCPYVQGEVSGPLDRDVVCIGNSSNRFCTEVSQNFVCATKRNGIEMQSVHDKYEFSCDGVFGLSAEGESPEEESAMGQFLRNSACKEKKVAFWLNRDFGAENGGEVTICGVDKNHYQVIPLREF